MVLQTPGTAAAWARGATIAVRSLRSGLPRCHPRPRLRRLLRIPSGASTRPARPGRRRTGLQCAKAAGRRGGRLAWHSFVGVLKVGRSCGAARCRPRGRPYLASECLALVASGGLSFLAVSDTRGTCSRHEADLPRVSDTYRIARTPMSRRSCPVPLPLRHAKKSPAFGAGDFGLKTACRVIKA